MATTFEVLQPITHSGDKQLYQPGAVVELNHLSEDDQNRLIAMGVVRKSQRKPTPPEPMSPEPPQEQPTL